MLIRNAPKDTRSAKKLLLVEQLTTGISSLKPAEADVELKPMWEPVGATKVWERSVGATAAAWMGSLAGDTLIRKKKNPWIALEEHGTSKPLGCSLPEVHVQLPC